MDPLHIHQGLPFRPDTPSGKKSEKSEKKKKAGSLSFQRLVSGQESETAGVRDASEVPSREELSSLLDDVFSRGEELKKSPTMNNIRQYRELVQRFMSLVSREAVDLEAQQGRLNPQTLERKQYYLLRSVDSKLDDLARAVLQQQKDALGILERVEEINSMLVDLLY